GGANSGKGELVSQGGCGSRCAFAANDQRMQETVMRRAIRLFAIQQAPGPAPVSQPDLPRFAGCSGSFHLPRQSDSHLWRSFCRSPPKADSASGLAFRCVCALFQCRGIRLARGVLPLMTLLPQIGGHFERVDVALLPPRMLLAGGVDL